MTRIARSPGKNRFALIAGLILLFICIVPVATLLLLGPVLERGCTTLNATDGEAGPVLVWRIETVRCGNGPAVTNVLLAPRGKTLVLAASATGQPRPRAVTRSQDGITAILLDGAAADGAVSRVLALKPTGRPAYPLVLADGRPKS
jgi:hypothetical protein